MIALVDALVILALAGLVALAVGDGAPVAALPVAAWIAAVTPVLIRTDLAERRLPDLATLPAAALVAVGALAAGLGAGGWSAAVALGVTAAVGGVAWWAGALGLGDVKLGAALAGGAELLGAGGAATALVGCGAAGLVALAVGAVRSRARRRRGSPARPRPSPGIPYGPCLLAGYWVAVAGAAG